MDEDDVARLDYEARDVWLVKVPQRVAQAWDKLTEEDVQLGKVRIHHAAEGERPRISFHVNADDDESLSSSLSSSSSSPPPSLTAPKDFSLQFNDNKTDMRVFSKSDGGVEMQGTVEYSFFMQPMRSQQYDNTLKRRAMADSHSGRVTKEVDGRQAMRLSKKKNRIVKMDQATADGEESEDEHGNKKPKGLITDEGLARSRLFEMYARKDTEGKLITHYKKKDLKRLSGIAESILNTLLKSLAEYNRDGDYATCYNLKPEFRSA